METNTVLQIPNTSFLDASQYVDFWITWDVDAADNTKRRIRVGTGHKFYVNEFIRATVDRYDVNYIAVGTGFLNTDGADWQIYY